MIFNYFEKLNFNKILCYDIAVFKGLNNSKKKILDLKNISHFYLLPKFLLGTLFKMLFTFPIVKYSNKKKIFYLRSQSIPHMLGHTKVYEKLNDTTVCIFTKRIKKISLINIFQSIYIFFILRKNWAKTLNKNGIKIISIDGLYISISLLSSFSDAIKIFPIMHNYSKVVSFQEICKVENILCQLANFYNLDTFALEHGVGTFKLKNLDWQKVPLSTYTSSVCKNILCWGKFSKSIFSKFTNAKVHVIGKAKISKKKYVNGVTIIFHHQNWKAENKKLFKIAQILKKADIPVSYWFKSKNLLNEKKNNRVGPLSKIIIGNSSNFLLELGYLGFEVFLLKGSVFLNFLKDNSIQAKIKNIKNHYFYKKKYPKYIWKNFIECTSKESVKRYRRLVLN